MTDPRAYPTWLVARALGEAPFVSGGADAAGLRCGLELAFIPPGLPDPAGLLLSFALDCVDWDRLAEEAAAEGAARFARRPPAAAVMAIAGESEEADQ